jgi:cytochrome oxidase Cu insertion factor (SCO1/SenC/PrrC family)
MRWRKEPLLVALVVLGPFVFALLAYFGPAQLRPSGQLPNPDRELLTPVMMPLLPLQSPDGAATEADWARYRWSLIYARISPCEGQCTQHLERLTQVFLALGRDRERAQLILITTDDSDGFSARPGLVIGLLDSERDAELVRVLGRQRLEHGRFFVVDPLGNLILSYPPDADQKRMLEDLERLLDVSRIG